MFFIDIVVCTNRYFILKLSGWGNYPIKDSKISFPKNTKELIDEIKKGNVIARGNGRSYGDSSIGESVTVHMKHFNRIISFDETSGLLVAESGILLKDIINTYLPKGWFPSVTPGTKFVTLGGMIAADIHGKNHHKHGNFSNYVEWIDIVSPEGIIKRCSKNENSELFDWTMGGMGLTGIIISAAIKLRSVKTGWIKQKILIAENLDEAIDLFDTLKNATYSVAWIDCLKKKENIGRSVIMLGEHAEIDDLDEKKRSSPFNIPNKLRISIPFNFPSWFLNSWSVNLFNAFFYWKSKNNVKEKLIDWDNYFYPLDKVLGWNKVYGRKGFAQFQCVLPIEKSRAGLHELLNSIQKAKVGSFLSVLKRFGPQSGKFSFPMEGYTLALDFPINSKTLNLMDKLDEITIKYNGRLYLAKDSRMSKQTLLDSEKRLESYRAYRDKIKSEKIFNSVQSVRLGL